MNRRLSANFCLYVWRCVFVRLYSLYVSMFSTQLYILSILICLACLSIYPYLYDNIDNNYLNIVEELKRNDKSI